MAYGRVSVDRRIGERTAGSSDARNATALRRLAAILAAAAATNFYLWHVSNTTPLSRSLFVARWGGWL